MTREQRERIAASAASDWCRCFKCDGIINETGTPCDEPSGVTCIKFRDGYKTALIALEKAERWGIVKGDGEIVKDINGTLAVTAKIPDLSEHFKFGDKVIVSVAEGQR